MNDDNFFNQFQKEPRPEFADALYKRINQPMNTPKTPISLRHAAISFAAAVTLLLAALLVYPPARVQAFHLIRQIGAFWITAEPPADNLPTAQPPDPARKPVTAASAQVAGKLAGFPVLVPEYLPEGYLQKGEYSIVNIGGGKTVVSAYANPTQGSFILFNQYRYSSSDAYTDTVTGNEKVTDVQVRGQKGAWITGRFMTDPVDKDASALRETSWLVWEEKGINYTLIGDNLSLEEARTMAERLK